MIIIRTMHNGKTFEPVLIDEVQWETSRKGSPGQLTFTCLGDGNLTLLHGDEVYMAEQDELTSAVTDIFKGRIFTISHGGDNKIKVTAYDQLRYLKNTHSIVLNALPAEDAVYALVKEAGLKNFSAQQTHCYLSGYIGDGKTLFDMVQDIVDQVMTKGDLYVLYDDCGTLFFKNINSLTFPMLIDDGTCENYEFESSIDSDAYNEVVLACNNKDVGGTSFFTAENVIHKQQWGGTLRKYQNVDALSDAKAKASAMLDMYGHVVRHLTIKNALGYYGTKSYQGVAAKGIRAGNKIYVKINTGEVLQDGWLVAEHCTHKWKGRYHSMDLELGGGVFDAQN